MKILIIFGLILATANASSASGRHRGTNYYQQRETQPYSVPQATIEVFRPRGFRVSIPDEPGLQLFAFHGSVNQPLSGLAAGTYSRDIIQSENGRWSFVDTTTRLQVGDIINYWTFVQKDLLGFRRDNQRFVVRGECYLDPDAFSLSFVS